MYSELRLKRWLIQLCTPYYTGPTMSCTCNTTLGQVLIAWFNNSILGKSGQIANPLIAKGLPPYHIVVYDNSYVCKSINCKHGEN